MYYLLQEFALEERFYYRGYPYAEKREELASELGLTVDQVSIWKAIGTIDRDQHDRHSVAVSNY